MDWDWRYPIDFIRDEVRKSRSKGARETTLDALESVLDQAESMYERLERDHPRDGDFKVRVASQKEMLAHLYEKPTQYVNVIVLGGYAALFTLWSFSRGQIEPWINSAAGLSTLLSVSIYIGFELYVSWFRSTNIQRQMKALQEAEELGKFPDEYGKSELERARRLSRKWSYFFYPAVGFALVSACLLGYGFVFDLLSGFMSPISRTPVQ